MALDVILFPDPIAALLGLLNERWPGLAKATLPSSYQRSLLVRGTTYPATMVTQRTLYVIECRDRTSPAAAAALGGEVAAWLDAIHRGRDEPVGYELHSLATNYPDPDDGCPRAVVTCSITWSRTT